MAKRSVADREAKRVPIMSRVTPELRAKLDLAASEAGRSLAQELEFRLEQEFDIEQRIIDLMGGEVMFRMFIANASAVLALSRPYGKTEEDWFHIDDEAFIRRVVRVYRDNLFMTLWTNKPLSDEEVKKTRERKPKTELPPGVRELGGAEFAQELKDGLWEALDDEE